ncbi:lipase chaperone [Duganella sp. FT92W]|uniref:Lipase helper protein n=1 Tax=Pseudoduganella rivuli TaxID=2666085 RepID=A0A7X2IKI3_9BURK|nr:lipase secretion chaperone [Pseudoduganella rivuli]MRV71545.1 lipase chaperone [Pseudoduganella rivuli]
MNANHNEPRVNRAAVLAGIIGAAMLGGWLYAPSDAAPPAAPNATGERYFAFVRSMEGTAPDGNVKQDAADALVVDAELGHLFDYYLAGLGETSLESVRAEAERELARRLRPAAAAQARRLLASYIDYKRALASVEKALRPSGNLAKDARARHEGMLALRRQYFSPQESAGLFGDADAYAQDTIARLEIDSDLRLSAAERARKVAELDARLPDTLREQRDAPLRIVRLEEQVAQRRAQGADDNDIYRLRAAALDSNAAARMADVDREEAAWQRRMQSYLAERKQLLAHAGGADAEQSLRNAHFSPEEQRRLGAYE